MKQKGTALCPTLAAGDAISQYRGWRKGADPEPARIAARRAGFKQVLASGVTIFSSSAQICFLRSRFSKTASITKSASAKTDLSTEPLTRPRSLAAVPSSRRRLPTSLSIWFFGISLAPPKR